MHLPSTQISTRQRPWAAVPLLLCAGFSAFLPAAPAHAAASIVHDFNTTADGEQPYTKMVQAADGTFYGTTTAGGFYKNGTIFKVTPAGQFQTVYEFGSKAADGSFPYGALVIGPDNNIYGTTQDGGSYGNGTVFKLTQAGTESVLYSFKGGAVDGAHPHAGLTYVASDGNFYGTTYSGGGHSVGTAYRLTLAGAEKVIKTFSSALANPASELCFNPGDGLLYGAVDSVNGNSNGGIYKVSTVGALTLVKPLTNATGYFPQNNGLVLAADGNLYGTLTSGGANGLGTIYRVVSGVFSTVHSFNVTEASHPNATLVAAADGMLYGTSLFGTPGYGNIFKVTPGASPSVTSIYSFTSSIDGANPGPLMQAANGLLYGASQHGTRLAYGSVFNVTTTGSFFTIKDLNTGFRDGANPMGRLLLGQDGNWYGTTSNGGLFGMGTIYRISAGGAYNILYNFGQIAGFGSSPLCGLVQAPDGAFYGTTSGGGSNACGTVYKFTVSGSSQTADMSLVFAFDGTHGKYPQAPVIVGSDGNLYGTTSQGGTTNLGVVFKLTTTGLLTVLRTFVGTNGQHPNSAVVQGADGGLYGVTSLGGFGYGVLFKITTAGGHVWTRAITAAQNYQPLDSLVFGADGNLYGTSIYGGSGGSIFRVTPSGTVSTVYDFDSAPVGSTAAGLLLGMDNKLYGSDYTGNFFRFDGANLESLGSLGTGFDAPINSGLASGSDGSFYGASYIGGSSNSGFIYKLDVNPLPG